MDFLENAKTRYSVRQYQPRKLEKQVLDQILEAGRVAPTGKNNQPQRLIVVQSDEGMEKLNKAGKTFGAPCIIIVCADTAETWVRPQDGKVISDIDASIITDHMMLQATELGLGSVWMCWFDPEIIRNEFSLPDSWVPVNLLALGYADGEAKSPFRHDTMRKPLGETVFSEAPDVPYK